MHGKIAIQKPMRQRLIARIHIVLLFLTVLVGKSIAAEGYFPAWYVTTTYLNVRATDNVNGRKITTLDPGTEIYVHHITSYNWAAIDYNGARAFVSRQYIRYVRDAERPKVSTSTPIKKQNDTNLIALIAEIFGVLLGTAIVCSIIRKAGVILLALASSFMFYAYWIVCIPFYFLNWLQRYLSKPWRIFYKKNTRSDSTNERLRFIYQILKVPLYVLLTPLRAVNAFYYNIIVHCSFELYNYALEILLPTNDKEGADDDFLFFVYIPWRIARYIFWHGSLTLLESAIWTVIDTFVPALTLFHGTSESASVSITNAGRDGHKDYLTGTWNVGAGNFAGNGIYFAPARSTSLHYANGALIVCRVSLGNVLDLGLAPRNIYNQCGYQNATGATKWGLKNGYVTGEWWRGDAHWWEYCMYDWQNRYNYSWRIRPLYVLNLNEKYMQRIPGGMSHWLFREMVIKDIITYFKNLE